MVRWDSKSALSDSRQRVLCHLASALLAVLFLARCGGAPKWAVIDLADTPAQARYPEADAVVLFDMGKYEFEEQVLLTRHVAMKILNQSGLEHANVEISLSADDDIDDIEGRTIRPDGSVFELDSSDIHEVPSFSDFTLYRDARSLVLAMPGVQVGSVIEYRYTLVFRLPYPPIWYFQSRLPVLHSRFEFEAPQEVEYSYLLTQPPEPEVTRRIYQSEGKHRGVFEARDLPPVPLEPCMPPIRDVAASLRFSVVSYTHDMEKRAVEGDSWKQLGQRYYLMTRGLFYFHRKDPDPDLIAKVAELTRTCKTARERVENLYEFMQAEIRYVAIALHESGIIPNAPKDIFRKRYGDCKDQAFLFLVMLEEAGIDAYPVLVRPKDDGRVLEDFVSFGQFNHMVVGVPTELLGDGNEALPSIAYRDPKGSERSVILLDTTSRSISCWTVPWHLEGTKAVVVEEDGGTLITVPVTTEQANRTLTQCDLELEEDGTLSGSMEVTRMGQNACRFRTGLLEIGRSGMRDWFKEHLSTRCPGAILENVSVMGLTELEEPLTISYEFRVPHYAECSGDLLIFRPSVLRDPFASDLTRKTRKHSICFDVARSEIEATKIRIPEGFRVRALVDCDVHSAPFADFVLGCFEQDDAVVLNRQIQIRETRIPADRCDEVRALFQTVLAGEGKSVTLERIDGS